MKLIFSISFVSLLGLAMMMPKTGRAQQLPQDPDLRTGKLPNGLSYFVRKNSAQKKRATLYFVSKAGSILEADNQRGLAHFMEHMSFNGTKHFPAATLVDFLEKAGVRFGADLNAYTSFDETVYQLPLPLDKPEMLNQGLQVLRDWAGDAILDPVEIDKERGVVLEEKRLRTGSSQRIQQQTFPLLVNHSLYASREPIGTEEVLKNFKKEDLLSFYKDWYRPDLQAVIVVGDVDPQDIVSKISNMFGDLKPMANPKERPVYKIPLNGENQFLATTDKEISGTALQLTIKSPHRKLQTNADYLEFVKRNLFNQLLSARFQSVAQKNAQNYLYVGANVGPLVANLDGFNATLSARPGELEKGFGAFWTEISKIKASGFSEEEIQSAKTAYLNNFQAAASESDKKQNAQYAQEYVRLFLDGEASPGVVKELSLTESYLPMISAGHLRALANTYITDKNRDVIIVAPEAAKSGLPDKLQMDEWFAKYGASATDAQSMKDNLGTVKKAELLATLPKKGSTVSSKKIKELGVTELVLSNGVRVLLKPTSFKNDEINFTGFSSGGTSTYSDKDFQSALNATSLIASGGIGNFSAEELRERLTGQRVGVTPYIAEKFQGISGFTSKKELETALQLTYLYFTAARKDTVAFNANMSRSKAALSQVDKSPERKFSDTITATLNANSIRRKQGGLPELNQINYDRALEIYKQVFSDASGFTFVFVGSFEPEAIKELLEQYLGSLPSTSSHLQSKDLGIEIPGGIIKKRIFAGEGDKATVQMVFSGKYNPSPENITSLQAIRYILGMRMVARLREREGGAYSPSVSLSASRGERAAYSISIRFGCAADNSEKLIAAARQEIQLLKAEGPTQDEISKFITEEEVGYKNSVESNPYWLGYLSAQLQDKLELGEMLTFDSHLKALSREEIKNQLNRFLNEANYIEFQLLPEKFLSDK